MIRIPNEVIQHLIFYAQANDLGMASIGNEDITMIIIGDKRLGPDGAALLGARILIDTILNNQAQLANIEAETKKEDPKVN